MSDIPAVKPGQELPKATQDAQFRRVYANDVTFGSSLFDLRLMFSDVSMSHSEAQLEQKVEVILSPQHAKVLSIKFGGVVAEYEKRFGRINIPNLIPSAGPEKKD